MIETKVIMESLPESVQRVINLAIESGKKGMPELSDVVYAAQREDGTVTICDNYERWCSLILDWDPSPGDSRGDGQWSIRTMYSGMGPRKISQEEAEANATLMFHG